MEDIDYERNILDSQSSEDSSEPSSEFDESTNDESLTTQSTTTPPQTFLDPNDIGPSTVYYRGGLERPDIQELRKRTKDLKITKKPPVDKKEKKLNSFTGVFLPVIVSLISMTYFTRAGKLVGDLGVVYALLIIWVSCIICVITITSLVAIGTNGEISYAGTPYVMSRTIGPELGRAITFFLDLSSCLASAVTVVGFAESLVSLYDPKFITGSYMNDLRLLSFFILIIATVLNKIWDIMISVSAFTHLVGITCFFIGCFTRTSGSTLGFLGPSAEHFQLNLWGQMTVSQFFSNFYMVAPDFTSLTGCFAFGNGLKRPQKMIPKGLWWAFGVFIFIWHLTIILIALCSDRQFLIDNVVAPLVSFNVNPWICLATFMVYGLFNSMSSINYQVYYLVDLAVDGLIPPVKYRYNYWLPLSVTAIFCGIGNLDFTKNINTIFFLQISLIINFCVYLASKSHIPGWRPKSKFWNPYVSLFGAILTVVIQFMMDWQSSIVNWILWIITYGWSHYKGSKDVNWGSVMQARSFYEAYKHALTTQRITSNPKLFRMNLLTIVDEHEEFEKNSLQFIDTCLGKEGFIIVSKFISVESGLQIAMDQRSQYEKYYAEQHNIFYETVIANNAIEALENEMLNGGIGAFRPNTVLVNMDFRPNEEVRTMVLEVLEAKFGMFLITRPNDLRLDSTYVDVYWISDEGGLTLLAGYVMAKNLKKKLRVMNIAYTSNGDSIEAAEQRMQKLCQKFRIEAEVIALELSEKKSRPSSIVQSYWDTLTHKSDTNGSFQKFLLYADMLREYSSNAALVVSTLFIPTDDMDGDTYDSILKTISNIPPPVAFVRGNGSSVLSWKV